MYLQYSHFMTEDDHSMVHHRDLAIASLRPQQHRQAWSHAHPLYSSLGPPFSANKRGHAITPPLQNAIITFVVALSFGVVCQPRLSMSTESAREILALQNTRHIAAEWARRLLILVGCMRMTFGSCFSRNNFGMKVVKISRWLIFMFLLNYEEIREDIADHK